MDTLPEDEYLGRHLENRRVQSYLQELITDMVLCKTWIAKINRMAEGTVGVQSIGSKVSKRLV